MKGFLLALAALLVVVWAFALMIEKVKTGNTEAVRRKLRCFVEQRFKAVGLLCLVGGWFLYPYLADFLTDDGQRPILMDVGVFQTLPFALIRGLALYWFTKKFLGKEAKAVHRYFTGLGFVRDFYRLTPWQKQILTAVWLLASCYLFGLLTH